MNSLASGHTKSSSVAGGAARRSSPLQNVIKVPSQNVIKIPSQKVIVKVNSKSKSKTNGKAREVEMAQTFEGKMTEEISYDQNSAMVRVEEQSRISSIYCNDDFSDEGRLQLKSKPIAENIFSMMIVSQPNSLIWLYGLVIIIFQIVAVALIIHEQCVRSIPIEVDKYVTFGQFFALIIVMIISDDFINSIKSSFTLHYYNVEQEKSNNTVVMDDEDEEGSVKGSLKESGGIPKRTRIIISTVLQLIGSSFILIASLVVIVHSEKLIQLFINLIVLKVISHCSKWGYSMAKERYFGSADYFGSKLAEAAQLVNETQLIHCKPKHWRKIPIYTFVIAFVFTIMVVVWGSIFQAQQSRKYLKQMYNACFDEIGSTEFEKVSDGSCDGTYNTLLCGYDGGDCVNFNKQWPACTVLETERIQDGICDASVGYSAYNTKQCGWDGGDCIKNCTAELKNLLGDGHCENFYPYNTAECSFDGGDCSNFNLKYKNCACPENDDNCSAESVIYNVENGKCNNYAPYNTRECKFDGGDCDLFFKDYPDCSAEHTAWIGDGVCHSFDPYNTADCGYDGGDCQDDGNSNGNGNAKCSADRVDWINDGHCDNFAPYNTAECGYDGGECVSLNKRYPNCMAPYPEYIGDGYCDGPLWNTAECDYDGGDCDSFKYPQCEAFDYWELGNGRCWDKDPYNTVQCGYDGGDCINLKDRYPDCDITKLPPYFKWFPTSVGDKFCELEFNTTECGWDGGDCV